MFYMFGQTEARKRNSTDQSYQKQRDIFGLCHWEVIFQIFVWLSMSLSKTRPKCSMTQDQDKTKNMNSLKV